MGQSYVKNYTHIVFSTKNREPRIQPAYENELHAYLGAICNDLESPVIKVGGYVDHIHILCLLSKKIALMQLVQKVKAYSSKWMKTKTPSLSNFYWQDGYGAFSVSPSEVDMIKNYIANQHKHHTNISFKEEFITILKKHDVDYNEKYIWE